MKPKSKGICPFINKTCRGIDCTLYSQILGTHPQTGVQIDEWDCSINWLPVLLIEAAKEGRHTAAAVESFRNESINNSQKLVEAIGRTNDIKRIVVGNRVIPAIDVTGRDEGES